VKAIFMETNDQPIQKLTIPAVSKFAMYLCVAGIIITGLASVVYDYIYSLSFGL
ncbi:MAG: hypothetical protein RL363_725, partial [Bacteroidota bacterium]